MNCKSTLQMLSSYLDRELAPQERDAVRAHLAACDRCRAEEHDLRSLKGLLLGVRAPEPAEDFERRLMSRLRQEAARPTSRPLGLPRIQPLAWGQLGGLAAAACMAVFVATRPGTRTEIVREPSSARPVRAVAQNADPELYEAFWQGGDLPASPLMPSSYGP